MRGPSLSIPYDRKYRGRIDGLADKRQRFVVRRNVLGTHHFLTVVPDHLPVLTVELSERDGSSGRRLDCNAVGFDLDRGTGASGQGVAVSTED
jgi:hypothetical protein